MNVLYVGVVVFFLQRGIVSHMVARSPKKLKMSLLSGGRVPYWQIGQQC